jgi:hypothetical protein
MVKIQLKFVTITSGRVFIYGCGNNEHAPCDHTARRSTSGALRDVYAVVRSGTGTPQIRSTTTTEASCLYRSLRTQPKKPAIVHLLTIKADPPRGGGAKLRTS